MTKYRDELVKEIKATGQEIIDRAEQMVSKKTDLITDFVITVRFIQGECQAIQWTTEVINKTVAERKFNK